MTNQNKSDGGQTLFTVFREIGIINQLSSAMFQRRLPDGLHPSHFALLSNLMRMGDGKTPQALASAFQVPKATMTNTLMVLSKRGLIDQRPNPNDKRSKLVFLTDAGRAFFTEAIAAVSPALGDVLNRMPDVELEVMLVELQKMRAFLDDNRDI